MKWYELCVHTSNEASEAVSNILHEFTSGGITIEDPLDISKKNHTTFGEIYELDKGDYPNEGVFIKTYFSRDPRVSTTLSKIQNAVQDLATYHLDVGEGSVVVTEVEEENWATAWKKFYKPVKISNRIWIKPTWESIETITGDTLVIELDPGMAFGTGTHPTTKLCVRALEKYVKSGDTVIDVGCGSGILSIAAGRLGAKSVNAFDLDDVAVSSTQNNACLNKLDDVIQVRQNNLLEGVKQEADVIVSNILAEIIVTFVQDAWDCLSEEGYFITSGIITEKKELVISKLRESGFSIIDTNEQDDWVAIIAQRRSI